MDAADFRLKFPEFGDNAKYPTAQLEWWGNYAERQISLDRWGDDYIVGVYLLTAHLLTVNQTSTIGGQVIASGDGKIASKSVGGVSVSYDYSTGSTTSSGAGTGNFGATKYGKQYFEMVQMYGVGCISI